MEVSLICIKTIKELENCDSPMLDTYINFFKIGHIYNFDIILENIEIEILDRDVFSYKDSLLNEFFFHKKEIDEYFMELDKWRELKINKILNND